MLSSCFSQNHFLQILCNSFAVLFNYYFTRIFLVAKILHINTLEHLMQNVSFVVQSIHILSLVPVCVKYNPLRENSCKEISINLNNNHWSKSIILSRLTENFFHLLFFSREANLKCLHVLISTYQH